jgi:putative oxidoreductase
MRIVRLAAGKQLDLGLAILRVIAGVIFVAHGGQKLFVYGLDGVAAAFGQMGIPLAALAGPAVALVEFLGGLALVIGLLTQLAGFGLVVTMLGALLLVHRQGGFFLPNGYEFVLALLGAAATLMVTGAGRYSLDALVGGRRETAARGDVRQFQRAA